VHAQAAVNAGARQTDEDAEFRGRPLRGRRVAVTADVVLRFLLDREELQWREEKCLVNMAPFTGREGLGGPRAERTLDLVSGSTSHMALEAIVGDNALLEFLAGV
jgi:hypothetical protein